MKMLLSQLYSGKLQLSPELGRCTKWQAGRDMRGFTLLILARGEEELPQPLSNVIYRLDYSPHHHSQHPTLTVGLIVSWKTLRL